MRASHGERMKGAHALDKYTQVTPLAYTSVQILAVAAAALKIRPRPPPGRPRGVVS